ncbi:hypothetical protein E2C01_098116 [Portunus trituberculatus]|uniref:Uncharacterized protein n=1 Tax=Portunus trituberculatus TaxID=210409 RepID=A0A5B7K7J0_PORTR|nr:hypothetical protein [Portunus trituberculatus]
MLKSGEGRPVPFSTILASHGRAGVAGDVVGASWTWQCGGMFTPCVANTRIDCFSVTASAMRPPARAVPLLPSG